MADDIAPHLHDGQLDTSEGLVRSLIATQFPQWAQLPIRRFASPGTVNALFRLGEKLVVRLPLLAEWSHDREHTWLPRLAPLLPVTIPEPVAVGDPAHGYPVPWSVFRWISGATPDVPPKPRLASLAADLGRFVAAMVAIDLPDPPPGRGNRLVQRDEGVRTAIDASADLTDTTLVTRLWDEALAVPSWEGPPRWIHGDLLPSNLLVRSNRLTGVIDFGEVGVGDPAWDLLPAWTLFDDADRDTFRAALHAVDEATWLRGKGYALAVAITALHYYLDTNQHFVDLAQFTLDQVFADSR